MPAPEHASNPSLPDLVHASDPWTLRFYSTQLSSQSDGPAGSNAINAKDQETYGNALHPIRFRVGNGGAGYTGVLRELVDTYIAQNKVEFRVGWVTNHSRHSQIALLADIVQVALTYEPVNEEIAIEEGWATRVGRVFNDHFILVGPHIELQAKDIGDALRNIARSFAVEDANLTPTAFHTRGDGSATFAKEQVLWRAAGIDVSNANWVMTYPLAPYDALVKAESEGAFLLTDRATFLTAKRDKVIPSLRVHIEHGRELLNPCSALVKSDGFVQREAGRLKQGADEAGAQFARWLVGEEAQDIIRSYGRQWHTRKPLFTGAREKEFAEEDLLAVM